MVKHYIALTKPGIIFGNTITLLAGFFLASNGQVIDYQLLTLTVLAMVLVVAAGCVFNNAIDQDIDKLMHRTKNRVMALELLQVPVALVYATILGSIGLFIFTVWVNLLTALIAFTGLFVYVGLYSLWFKRNSRYGTEIGAIAGAVPPLIGFCAVSNQFNLAALVVFAMLFIWQLPHFYAIAIYRLNDYKAAGIPVLPSRKNMRQVKIAILVYILAFTVITSLPFFLGLTDVFYLVITTALNSVWLLLALSGFKHNKAHEHKWARQIFIVSVINITAISFAMMV